MVRKFLFNYRKLSTQVSAADRVKLPLPLLLGRTVPIPTPTPPLLTPHLHTLTHTTPTCPYKEVRIQAPVCGYITRSVQHINRINALRWMSGLDRSYRNCSIRENRLPRQLVLGKYQQYRFEVMFRLDPSITGTVYSTVDFTLTFPLFIVD